MKTKHLSSKFLTLGSLLAVVIMLLLSAQSASAQSPWLASPSPSPNTNIYYNAGNVGIGTASPSSKLTVFGSASDVDVKIQTTNTGTTSTDGFNLGVENSTQDVYINQRENAAMRFFVNGAERFILKPDGNVGIGTSNPSSKLTVFGSASDVDVKLQTTNTGTTSTDGFNIGVENSSQDVYINQRENAAMHFFVNGAERFILKPDGNVGIGNSSPATKLHVQGDGRFTGSLTVDGNINAKYQDVAEWVPASEQLPAGTVVVLDSTKSNQVISSTESYDTRVAGVVSAQPGIALGESGANKVLVATTGRVLVRVDASRAPIHIGDLLVTSDVQGAAMKSEPINLGGRKMHMPGTLIGKALEPMEKGSGKILVLLSLQ